MSMISVGSSRWGGLVAAAGSPWGFGFVLRSVRAAVVLLVFLLVFLLVCRGGNVTVAAAGAACAAAGRGESVATAALESGLSASSGAPGATDPGATGSGATGSADADRGSGATISANSLIGAGVSGTGTFVADGALGSRNPPFSAAMSAPMATAQPRPSTTRPRMSVCVALPPWGLGRRMGGVRGGGRGTARLECGAGPEPSSVSVSGVGGVGVGGVSACGVGNRTSVSVRNTSIGNARGSTGAQAGPSATVRGDPRALESPSPNDS